MADEQAHFANLLQNLMSPDNNVRTQTEEAYDAIKPALKVPFLIQAMRNGELPLEVRSMAAVLLRRLYSTSFEEFWPQFDQELQAKVKQEMLVSIQEESQPVLQRKICDVTAEFARNMIDDDGNNTWPEVLKFLFDCASSQNPNLRESSLNVFAYIIPTLRSSSGDELGIIQVKKLFFGLMSRAVPGVFGVQQNQYLDVIKQMLQQCLIDQENKQVRFASMKATSSFLLANEKEMGILNHFKDLLPGMLVCIEESVKDQNDDALLKNLIDLAENCPKFLRCQLTPIITLCMKIVADANMPDQWRQLALEVIVTLSETAPAMVRKVDKFLQIMVPQILAMMVDLEEEPDWSMADEVEEEDNDSNSIAAESALDRLACGLGGKTMLPHILSNVPNMLANSDWRYRHAALMAISACGEGCNKQMELMLVSVVEAVLPYLQDTHPRVRYATCNALGQMATDFGPTFQKKFHDKVIPGLLAVMDDYSNPRVQSHAAAALVNFSEESPKNVLSPYLDNIVCKLEQVLNAKFKELLERGTKMVLEQVVTTLASVADTSQEKFTQYYDRFMPSLKYIVQNATNPELKLLRGKTIECISLIGLAVGRTKFMQDCSDVMQLLLKTQTEWEDLPEDDPQISYMISAWARMCKIMGKEFEQYLPLVMGPVLKAASLKPEVALVDNQDMKTLENDQDWQFVTLGDQQSFGIRTAGLEEKATACQMLVCYARELKEGFAEYAEQVVKIMVSHLKFYFHDGVRIAAAESLPYLLDCARIRGPEYVVNMWQYVCPELLKAVDTEPENDIKSDHMSALAQCIEKMGKGCLNEEHTKELVQILCKTLEEHFERQKQRQELRKDEDYDEIVEENLLTEDDEDVYLLSKVSDIMHSILGTHKDAGLPIFDQLLPHFTKLLSPDSPWPDRQWALCIFDDLVEHTGPLSLNYQQCFLQTMIQSLCDKTPEIRQASSYGIGVMAMHGGEGYIQALAESIPLLLKVIQDPESRAIENLAPTENCISAVTKICKYNPGHININELLPHWLSWLPVWEDEDEAVHIYNYLCDLVEANNPAILGDNNANLPRIVGIIADAFVRETFATNQEVTQRLVNIVVQIKGNEEIFQACFTQLSEPHQAALTTVLSS